MTILGRYAYILGNNVATGDNNTISIALVAAPSFLGFDPNGNITTVAPVLPTGDNLGNHTALQNLNLSTFQLVGNGGSQGLAISSSGNVGIGTSTPAATLDVNGAARAGTLTASTSVLAGTLTASTSVQTPKVLTPSTGSHNMLVLAYGSVGSGGSLFGTSENYTVTHTAGSGSYRITFSSASGLNTTNLAQAVLNLTLYGSGTGFISYSVPANTTGIFDVTTTATTGTLTDRGFSFALYLP